ncbi:hypothetical protein FGIG_03457 [Fasciola gigantica]|uniref:Uncharacterized protein n=1 Tax=Fasciola gigantica TaxID=46835 RepID=A0A504YQS0_FASGI|nr:hypothetical protein FGIG_03457 [Fasciola gigantica]
MEGPYHCFYINHCELESSLRTTHSLPGVRLFFDLEHHPRDMCGRYFAVHPSSLAHKVDTSKYGLPFWRVVPMHIVKSRSWIDDL